MSLPKIKCKINASSIPLRKRNEGWTGQSNRESCRFYVVPATLEGKFWCSLQSVHFPSWMLSRCCGSPTCRSICPWRSILISFTMFLMSCNSMFFSSSSVLRLSTVMLLSVFRSQNLLFCSFSRLSSTSFPWSSVYKKLFISHLESCFGFFVIFLPLATSNYMVTYLNGNYDMDLHLTEDRNIG